MDLKTTKYYHNHCICVFYQFYYLLNQTCRLILLYLLC
nr:MAG TPA: hypothetical protein [Caudoviricetes sp.]